MNDEKQSFTDRLIAAEHTRDRGFPNQRPKHAATLILLDHSGKEPTVLIGRRNPAHKFMPGKFVFPGGRLDPVDRRMSVASPLPGAVEQRLLAHLPNRGTVT
ncbi:MAG: NUDIX hydrolase, partial [Hyphomicrobiales bacterium]|nr:NUDIX hydrolase [Hyphomicrobiales bacterium]